VREGTNRQLGQRYRRQCCSRERKARPLEPLAEVVWERYEPVQHALRNTVILSCTRCFTFRLGFSPDIQERLVVQNIPNEARGPDNHDNEEQGTGVRASKESVGRRRGEIRAYREAVGEVENSSAYIDGDMRAGARRRTQRRYETSVKVVRNKERGKKSRRMGP